MRYAIITHTDMDGVGSAAIYIYLQGIRPMNIYFTEPYLLHRTMKKLANVKNIDKIVLMDLGANPKIFDEVIGYINRIRSRGIDVEWYDHHVWNEEWINRLRELGVRIVIDRSTCGAGVVARHAPRTRKDFDEEFLSEVVSGVCAGDLWRFDHWRGPWYLRLVKRRDKREWRLYVIDVISRGTAWTGEFTEKVRERLEIELREYSLIDSYIVKARANGYLIAVAPNSDNVSNSFTAAYVMGRTGADIVGIVSRNGKLSLRSGNVNIRELAVALGGGGHPRAAGALIRLPFIVRLKALFSVKPVLEYTLKVLADNIRYVSLIEDSR